MFFFNNQSDWLKFFGHKKQETAGEQKMRNKQFFLDLVQEVLGSTCGAQPVPDMNTGWTSPGVLI